MKESKALEGITFSPKINKGYKFKPDARYSTVNGPAKPQVYQDLFTLSRKSARRDKPKQDIEFEIEKD